MPEQKTYLVSPGRFGKIEAEIASLNRRAARLGTGAITLTLIKETTVSYTEHDPILGKIVRSYPACEIQVEGTSPRIAGWVFIGSLEHLEAGNVIRNISTEEVPRKYRTADCACDHCKLTRRRRDTYIVRKDGTKKYMQVGKSCLKDFTGHPSPESLASWLSGVAGLVEDLGNEAEDFKSSRGDWGFDPLSVVAFSIAWIKINGYMSKASAELVDGWPTSAHIKRCFDGEEAVIGKYKEKGMLPTTEQVEAQKRLAKKVIAWAIKEGTKARCSEFASNLSTIINGSAVYGRSFGFAVSAYPSYQKDREREADRLRKAKSQPTPEIPYLGEVGKRQLFGTLEVTKVREFDGDYGLTTIVGFVDSEGHVFEWKASGGVGLQFDGNWKGVEVGDKALVTGTVKAHGPNKYNGDKPTTFLQRCKLAPSISPQEARGKF